MFAESMDSCLHQYICFIIGKVFLEIFDNNLVLSLQHVQHINRIDYFSLAIKVIMSFPLYMCRCRESWFNRLVPPNCSAADKYN